MSIGSQILYYREKAGLTQDKLGELMGVSFQTVSNWELDKNLPKTEKLVDLAKVLNTTVGRLLEEYEDPHFTVPAAFFEERHMNTFVKSAAVAKGYHQTMHALEFARIKHSGQFRKTLDPAARVPYIYHPLCMACQALSLGLGDEVIAAALLHDVLEDGEGLTAADLPVGETVREAVVCLTKKKFPDGHFSNRDYYAGIRKNPLAALVKCLDRVNNLASMAAGFDHEKMTEYVRETEEYVLPLIRLNAAEPMYNNANWNLNYQLQGLLAAYKRLL